MTGLIDKDATSSIGGKIVRGAVWSAAEAWGRQAATFVIFIILARNLDPEAFGFAALAMVGPVIFAVPVTKGIPDALIQRPEIDPLHLDSAFWFLSAVGAGLSALIWASAGMIAAAFSQPLLEDLVRWTSVIVALQALAAVPSAVLRRDLHFRLFALRTFASSTAGGVLGIGMAIAGFGVWSLVGMQVGKVALETAIMLLGSGWHPRLRYSQRHCRDLFGFAGPIVIQSLWNFVNEEMPKVVLGTFLGPHAVGVYALARRPLDLLVEVFINPLMSVAMPAVSRMHADSIAVERFFDTTMRVAGLAAFPVFFGFAALAPVIVPFVFGEQWTSAVLVVQLLMVLGLQRTIDSLCAFTILALGHARLILAFNVIYTVLGVISLPLAAQVGLEATVITLIACNVALLPAFLFYTQRVGRIDVLAPLAMFPRLTAAAGLMFVCVAVWRLNVPPETPQLLTIAGGIAIGAVVYLAAAFSLMRAEVLSTRDLLLRLRAGSPS